MTVCPNGDYYIFARPDFSTGTFGHPWEKTLCVFGAELVQTLGQTLATWLPLKREKQTNIEATTTPLSSS